MKCQTTKIQRLIGSIMLIIGVLVGVGAKFLTHNTSFHVDYLYGVSCGMVVASIAVLIVAYIRNKNEKYRTKDIINEQDERNQLISRCAASIAYSFLFYGMTLLFVVDLFIPLSFHFAALFLILATAVVNLIAANYYGKKY
ncbi:MAG: hypothetical protein ACRDDX_01930 [Cellulosilyticaceae bacterium]